MTYFFQKKSFPGFIKNVVTSVPSEELNRFYKVVVFCPVVSLLFSELVKHQGNQRL